MRFNNNIKNFKPKKNSKYHQGYYTNPKKCFNSCKDEPIIYRSGLELQFIEFCEGNPRIKRWASEPIDINYICRLDNKQHKYYPDYILETDTGNRIIVEIKPYQQTIKPSATDSLWLKEQWIKNTDKWKAAHEFAHNLYKNGRILRLFHFLFIFFLLSF